MPRYDIGALLLLVVLSFPLILPVNNTTIGVIIIAARNKIDYYIKIQAILVNIRVSLNYIAILPVYSKYDIMFSDNNYIIVGHGKISVDEISTANFNIPLVIPCGYINHIQK